MSIVTCFTIAFSNTVPKTAGSHQDVGKPWIFTNLQWYSLFCSLFFCWEFITLLCFFVCCLTSSFQRIRHHNPRLSLSYDNGQLRPHNFIHGVKILFHPYVRLILTYTDIHLPDTPFNRKAPGTFSLLVLS